MTYAISESLIVIYPHAKNRTPELKEPRFSVVSPRAAIWVASGKLAGSVSSMPSFGCVGRTTCRTSDDGGLVRHRFGRTFIGQIRSCN